MGPWSLKAIRGTNLELVRTSITLMWDPPSDTGGDLPSACLRVWPCVPQQANFLRGLSPCIPPQKIAEKSKAMVDFYRLQADDGLGGAFGDVAVVAGTYTTIEPLGKEACHWT